MAADAHGNMELLSDVPESMLDLNLSLNSKNTSMMSNDFPTGSLAVSNHQENKDFINRQKSGEFKDGGSQSNGLSMINRKRNRVEGFEQRRDDTDEEESENTRKKLRLSWDQTLVLEETFKRRPTLNATQKESLAKELGIQTRQVEVWFQNRRARIKVKQTEAEAEYMKQNCISLMDRVRRLQKEVNELRALKQASQFYMQIPSSATTLAMCPSCERVGIPTASSEVINMGRVKIEEDSGRIGLGSEISWPDKNQGPF